MVRERASAELATLLLHPQLGDATRDALLQWIAGQRLESVAALGLLPFLRARMQSGTYSIPLSELVNALRAPSILAWLLFNEVETRHSLPFAAACRHAETAPSGFTPSHSSQSTSNISCRLATLISSARLKPVKASRSTDSGPSNGSAC